MGYQSVTIYDIIRTYHFYTLALIVRVTPDRATPQARKMLIS